MEIVDKVGGDLRAILRRPDFVEQQIASKGLEAIASTPEELSTVVQKETAALKTMIDAAKLQAE